MQLIQRESLPVELLTATVEQVHDILPEPTLIHLQGKHPQPLFVSVLLHGNEPTGFLAIQQLLQKYQHQPLPRSLSLFFGNTQAAQQGLRRLEGQVDFNRIWPGTEVADCPETQLTQQIFDEMCRRQLFASVDVHNNTGLNPHYVCLNKLEPEFLQLGSLFGRLMVYFIHPRGTQSGAFAQQCPAVTLECGRPHQQHGTEHALEFLEACLHLSEFSHKSVHSQDVDLFHTVAQVTIKESVSFSFTETAVDLQLYPHIERINFTEIIESTVIAQLTNTKDFPVIAKDEQDNDVTKEFFAIEEGQLQIIRPTMPAMFTLDEKVISQDCLCYLMERIKC